jgi:uncharacterized protein (TIGR00730 family)
MTHVSVFGSSQSKPGDTAYQDAVKLGTLLARRGHVVVNGGYAGLMEAVSAGAAAAGGQVIGVTVPTVFPGRSGANEHLTSEIPAPDLIDRIRTMIALSDAAIALPGSLGTLTELVMTWNVNYVAQFSGDKPIPLIAVGSPWSELVPLLAGGVATDGRLVTCVDSVEEAIGHLDGQIPPN